MQLATVTKNVTIEERTFHCTVFKCTVRYAQCTEITSKQEVKSQGMLKGDARQSIVCKSSVSSGWTCLLIHTWEVGAVWQLFANHPYHPEGPAHQYIRGPCSATVVWKSSVSPGWTDLLIHKRSARCGNFLQIILIILMDQPFEVGAVWQLFANHLHHPDGPTYWYKRGWCGHTSYLSRAAPV